MASERGTLSADAAPDPSQLPDLPVRAVLGAVTDALAAHGSAVLVAPPGTGKTTLVPLALAAASIRTGAGCWSPNHAGWPPGRPRPGWPSCSVNRSVRPSATRCGATPAGRIAPASRW